MLIGTVAVPVFFSFARQLCQWAREKERGVEDFSHHLQEFRWALSRELSPESPTNSAWWEPFDRDVLKAIEMSANWQDHLQERVAVAEQHLDAQPTTRSAAAGVTTSVAAEKERRQRLLADYKKITGVRFNKQIYEAARVHKSEFLKWQRGELPAGSTISQRFERFLREMKPPRAGRDG